MVKQRINSEVEIKVLIEPMNNPLGVSPSKGNQVTTRGKEKIFDLGENRTHDLRIRSTVTLPTELRGWTEKVGDDCNGRSNPEVVGSIPTEVKDFFATSCGYLIPFTRANAQWVIHGFN